MALAEAAATAEAWEALSAAWRERFAALKVLLDDPARRAVALEGYPPAVQMVLEQARTLARSLQNKGLMLGKQPEYGEEQRLEYLELAARAAAFLGTPEDAAAVEFELGNALLAARRTLEAREAFERGLAREPAKATRYGLEARLAETCRRLGDWKRALEIVDRLLPELAGEPHVALLVERTRDFTYLDVGLPDRAWSGIEARWTRAEELRRNGGPPQEELREARLEYVHAVRGISDETRARELCATFLRDETTYADPREKARVLLLFGASEFDVHDAPATARGRELVRQAIELGLAPEERLYASVELAEAALRLGELDEAARELHGARELHDASPKAFDSLQRGRLLALEARLGLARGAAPAELLALRAGLEEGLAELVQQWQRGPAFEAGIAYLKYSKRSELVSEYTRVSIALDGPERGAELALAKLLELQALGTLARRARVAPTSLAEIRAELLGPGQGVLVYFPTNARSHVFALDDAGLVHAELAPTEELDELRIAYVSHLQAAIGAPGGAEERAALVARERELARALAHGLFPPAVAARMGTWNAASIVGTDQLGTLPLQWLPLGEHAHLGLALALDVLPSLPLGVAWSRRPARRFDLDYLLVGGAEHAPAVRTRWPELERIELTSELEQEFCSPYGGWLARTLRGAQASRASLEATDLARVRVLQFFVHGVEEPERERSMSLVLSPAAPDDAGLLRSEDAARLDAPGLVLLTGCRTGQGSLRKGDPDAATLAGAWLASGAQAVLASEAVLTAGDTRRISRRLSERLVAGASPAEALRDVRAELVREYGAEAPFHEGLLRLVGLGHRPVFPAQSSATQASGPAARGLHALLAGALGLALGVTLASAYSRRRGAGAS